MQTGEARIFVLVLRLNLDRRSHVLAISLTRLDSRCTEFILSPLDRVFESGSYTLP